MKNDAQDSGSDPQLFDQLVRLLKLATFINPPMKAGVAVPSGIRRTELKVLMALAGQGQLAGHDLVEIMGAPPMSISRAIAALRNRGWVEDAVDPESRRRRPVRITAAGREAFDRLRPSLDAIAQALLGGLSSDQQRQFADIADHVLAAMEAWIRKHHSEIRL